MSLRPSVSQPFAGFWSQLRKPALQLGVQVPARHELTALVCSQAVRKNPKYAAIHNTAGMIQVELGNLNSAVSEFNNARTLDPTFYEAQMNYAAVNLQFRGFAQAE